MNLCHCGSNFCRIAIVHGGQSSPPLNRIESALYLTSLGDAGAAGAPVAASGVGAGGTAGDAVTVPASTTVDPQLLQPEEMVATGEPQPQLGAGAQQLGAAAQHGAGAGAQQGSGAGAQHGAGAGAGAQHEGAGSQQLGAGAPQLARFARKRANKPWRGALHEGAGSQQAGAGAGSQQAAAGAGSQQAGAGAAQLPPLECNLANKPPPPQSPRAPSFDSKPPPQPACASTANPRPTITNALASVFNILRFITKTPSG
jgi:hypothetical protein